MKPTERSFAALCFIVLMDHHGAGYKEAHPSYIDEKLGILTLSPRYAFGMLDQPNQARVIRHLKDWGYEPPQEVAEAA